MSTWQHDRSKYTWAICERCRGEGKVDHPAFSNGISSDTWNDEWSEEDRESYLRGDYDVPCTCEGGRVKEPIIARLSFADKRELVMERRRAQWAAESAREQERESRMLGEW